MQEHADDDEEAAGDVECVGQVAQENVPWAYLPATHTLHACPGEPTKPALHVHEVADVLPVADVDSLGQDKQEPAPEEDLNLPAAQDAHGPPFDPVYPGLHTQSVCASLAEGEREFDGHAEQAPSPRQSL